MCSKRVLHALFVAVVAAPLAARAQPAAGSVPAGIAYAGTAVIVSQHDAACGPSGPVRVYVAGNRFTLDWESQRFDIKVRNDGSFYATTGISPAAADKRLRLLPAASGRLGAGTLVADYGTRWCRLRLKASAS
jgi:hypothetical protein